MRKLHSILAASACAVAMTAGAASAATTYGYIPGGSANNEALDHFDLGTGVDGSRELGGWYGAQLYLIGGPTTIEVEIMGYEAGFTNKFSFGGDSFSSGGGTNFGSLDMWSVANVASGLLGFSFGTDGGGGSGAGTVANGANPNNNGTAFPGINFFVSFVNDSKASSGQAVYLFFDDDGANIDDNHDDLVVKLSINKGSIGIAPIPVPAAGLLLVGALGGLAALRQRKRG